MPNWVLRKHFGLLFYVGYGHEVSLRLVGGIFEHAKFPWPILQQRRFEKGVFIRTTTTQRALDFLDCKVEWMWYFALNCPF